MLVSLPILLQGKTVTIPWRAPYIDGIIQWERMPHLMHMLRFFPAAGWSEYELYTLSGWVKISSVTLTAVPPDAWFLILRELGMQDKDCPGISRLIRRFRPAIL